MTTILKKGLFAIVSVAALLLTNSCSGSGASSDGYDLRKAEDVKAIGEILKANITPDMAVYNITLNHSKESSSFSLCKDRATIVWVNPENANKQKAVDINLITEEVTPSNFYENKPVISSLKYKGVKFAEPFDFMVLHAAITEAVKEMEEDKISVDGFSTINFWCSVTKPENIEITFDIQHKTGSTTSGNRVTYQYDEYEFKANSKGVLKN